MQSLQTLFFHFIMRPVAVVMSVEGVLAACAWCACRSVTIRPVTTNNAIFSCCRTLAQAGG